MTTIRRYKTAEELTGDEHLAQEQARRRGKPVPRFETDEYREARRVALDAAGLSDEPDDDDDKPIEDRTPDEHLREVQRSRW